MSGLRLLRLFLLIAGLSSAAGSQVGSSVVPVPSDPLELATGPTKLLDTPQDRSAILELVERARQNFDMQAGGTPPYDLKVTFDASGRVAYTGSGEMEEMWLSAQRWRWSANLGGYSQTRIFLGGQYFDKTTLPNIPMRVQMVRGSLLWPITGPGPHAVMKATPANWNGVNVICALFSGALNDAVATTGRQWQESEYCFDPATSLLMTYSEAPGIYASYDYSNSIRFHGRVIPREIQFVEAGSPVLNIHIQSLTDLGSFDQGLFKPTAEMINQPRGPILAGRWRMPRVVPAPSGYTGAIHPLIVHATVDAGGTVLEAEALSADAVLGDSALGFVRNSTWGHTENNSLRQRELFINVMFVPKQ
jgi:hypothetical protein